MPASIARDDAQTFYGQWSALYDVLARHTPGIAGLRRRASVACSLEPGDTVLEMGCGTGANLPVLREQVGVTGTVVGLDFTRPVLERARSNVVSIETVTDVSENVHVVQGDATAPPFDTADAVLATFVVGMLEDPVAAVDDWCDLVGTGGHVVLVNAAPSRAWYAPPVNVLFDVATRFSTPPTTRLRYETPPSRRLEQRVNAAHDRLCERSSAIARETHALGLVRLTAGRIA